MPSGATARSPSNIFAPSPTFARRCTCSRPRWAASWNVSMRPRLLLLLVALLSGCSDSKSEQIAQPAPAPGAPKNPVQIVQPEVRTRAAVRVNAPVTGRVTEVLARPGQVVEPGHPLFILDSPDLGQAKADYAKAISDLARADKALKLARDLFEMKAIAEKDIREAENDYNKAVAERDRAAARLRT